MNLLIVESPSKAKTIEKYLGSGWRVVASVGHVRDLVPEAGSVDIAKDFAPKWQIMPGKEKQLKLIIDELKKADAVYLASDPDREGEAIAWHINDILTARKVLDDKPVYRVAFHEITKNAIVEALKNPREIDNNLVDAYLVRRILDYLIGFSVSPLLWRRNLGKSAGRVQSVAVKLVVEREKEIEKFNPVEYWSIAAKCGVEKSEFDANLIKFDGEKIEKLTLKNKKMVDEILSTIKTPTVGKISSIEKKKVQRHAFAPFTTSTLQQDAANKLHFSSKRTMATAQKLYEAGFITYMRTDATNLSNEAVAEIREYIAKEYGNVFVPKTPNIYVTKSKNAQEAHEAIRPTHFTSSKSDLSGDELKLYNLIWKRTIACQMSNATFDSVSVDIDVKNAVFHCVGTTRTFDGFMKVYIEDDDEQNDVKLPQLNMNDEIEIKTLTSEQHFTQPPARFSEATLVKKLEELGIGRPSTYATIMSTIVDRKYVEQDKQHKFHPTMAGWVLVSYLSNYFHDLVDVNFTAKTEDTLDDVSNGKRDKLSSLESFWTPTNKTIDLANNIKMPEVIDKINEFMHDHLFQNGDDKCPLCGGKLGIKLSKYGAFIGCSNYPKCGFTKKLFDGPTNSDENKSDEKPEKTEKDLGENIVFKIGKFGPYVTNGTKNASAKKYTVDTITLDIARELLSGEKKKVEPIILGKNPETDKAIYYYPDGRYGPYLSSNRVNVSVKEQPSLETAIDLINSKKTYSKKAK